jgi:tRNA(Ile)-lysidine synthase
VTFREDASNASDAYTRNAIRNNILPVVEASFPNVVEHINGSIMRFAQVEMLYNRAIDLERRKLTELRGQDVYIAVKKLKQREPLETICYELFQP